MSVDNLYSNLDKLLNDICKFLADEGNYQKLSPFARQKADELINRSKKQLQEIAKINEYDGAYVDMERKPVDEDDDQNNIYISVEEANEKTPQVINTEINLHANLAAKDLSRGLKNGNLSWKCKTFFNFEKNRRIYAGIYNNWLLIYSSDKDLKPLQTFDLKKYKAEPIIGKQGKNLQDFQLLSTEGENKSYHFVATTHKDMLQWISHINRCCNYLQNSKNIIMPDDNECEYMNPEFDNDDNLEDLEKEEIYDFIDPTAPEVDIAPPVNKPPDLPTRRYLKNAPLPIVPKLESKKPNEDFKKSQVSVESISSFSSDDDDSTYDAFVQLKVEKKTSFNNIQKPKLVESDANLGNTLPKSEKPKPLAKPKIFPKKTF